MGNLAVLRKNVDWDKKFSIAINWYFLASAANAMVKIVLPIPESMWGLVSALFGGSILLMFAICINGLIHRNSKLLFQSYIFFFLIYTFSIVLSTLRGDPTDLIIKGSAFWTFVWWIPVGVLACSIYDFDVLYKTSLKFSFIISACALIMFVFHPIDTEHEDYSMSFGNIIIIPLLFHINEFYKKKNLLLLAFIILEIGTILIYANRGVLAALLFLFFYKSIFGVSKKYKAIMVVFLTIIVLFYIIFGSRLLENLLSTIEFYGLSSRTLEKILGGGLVTYTSGRDLIWAECFKMIEERPILGWGLGGEFYRLAAAEGLGMHDVNSSFHPHNSLLQCVVDFGVFFGLIIDYLIIRPFFKIKRIADSNKKNLIIIYGSAAVIPCCISACGFFVLPAVAIYVYMYYFSKHKTILK